jgi:Holliday junction resolvasome RuvABC endonuclease subunit
MFAGIDYSMTSPSITVGYSKEFGKCKTFIYNKSKKFEGIHPHNIYGIIPFPYEEEMERFTNISEWAISILKKFKVMEVCLEGYSMGSTGRVFSIAENTAVLKYMMYVNGIKYYTPAPTQVKKFFCGKGNAGKDLMHDAFLEKTQVNIANIFNVSTDKSPVSDIVDSYAMLCYGLDNYFN